MKIVFKGSDIAIKKGEILTLEKIDFSYCQITLRARKDDGHSQFLYYNSFEELSNDWEITEDKKNVGRELKFRAWGKNSKEYLGDSNQGFNMEELSRLVGQFKNWKLEQYTGIKDINGKEIYEGDIVAQNIVGVTKFEGSAMSGPSTIWAVRWNQDAACFELRYLRGPLYRDSLMSSEDEYKVIGNIHEAPKEEDEKSRI